MPVRASEPTMRNVVEPSGLAAGRSAVAANASTRSIPASDQTSRP
jgi:hypothetical protein